jgi:hypothetical protein
LLEESDSEDLPQNANNLPEDIAGGYSLYSMEENVSLHPMLSELTEDTDVPATVVVAEEVAGPMMSTKSAAGDTGITAVAWPDSELPE